MSVSKVDVALPNFTYFGTARIRIVGPTGLSTLTRSLLDSGSEKNSISTSIIDTMKVDVVDQRNMAVGAFELQSIRSSSQRLFRLDLRGICTNSSTTIIAFESAY